MRVAFSIHPEVLGRSQREESTAYAHYESGRLVCFELGGTTFTVQQFRALAELSGWSWELFLAELRFLADEQRPEPAFLRAMARA